MDLETQNQPDAQQKTISVDIYHADWSFERGTDDEERVYQIRTDGSDALEDDPLTLAEFVNLYDHVGSDTITVGANTDDSAMLGTIYDGWNADGFTQTSAAFINAQTRSLSIGDVIQIAGDLYMVDRFGFGQIDFAPAGGER